MAKRLFTRVPLACFLTWKAGWWAFDHSWGVIRWTLEQSTSWVDHFPFA